MKRIFFAVVTLFLLSPLCFAEEFALSPDNPLDARALEIVKMIPEKPESILPPISDRDAWEKIAQTGNGAAVIKQAEKILNTPMPELPDELYLEYSRNGNRTNCQRVIGARHGRLAPLVVAECIENKGRFIPELERFLLDVCKEKSWVLPAHDPGNGNFNGTGMNVDLASSALSWDLATAYNILGDKLSPEVRQTLLEKLEERNFKPYETAIKTGKFRPLWWITGENNWNAVCHAGMCGAALAAIDDPARRAWYIAAAEKYSAAFIKGFTPDGYCSEGLGYWSYGFGNYIRLSETIRRATNNKINLMDTEFCETLSKFPLRIQIMSGISPAFADCGVGAKAPKLYVNFLAHIYGWDVPEYYSDDELKNVSAGAYILKGMYSLNTHFSTEFKPVGVPIRDYFNNAGILVCRPCADPVANKPGDKDWDKLAAAVKAGHNAEFHNHNDVGSYTIVYHGQPVLMDVGGEVYTKRTFSGQRYVSRVINSWGHPVPMINGQLQATGGNSKGVVVKDEFSDEKDVFAFEYQSCYPAVKELKKLERSFVYDRKNNVITITDQFQLDGEAKLPFDSALTTIWDAQRDGDSIIVGKDNYRLRIEVEATTVDASGNVTKLDWEFTSELCNEDQGGLKGSKRLGVVLPPVNNATVRFTVKPL